MSFGRYTRRDFPVCLTAMLPLFGMAGRALSFDDPQAGREGVSHTSESIHQEVMFKATRRRIYEALTQEKEFRRVTDFVMKGASAEISTEVGGAFSIFGGVILGRHIELLPYDRIVQAWREKDWPEGVYSIVKFDLREKRSETELVFDHTGFPQGAASHLAPGWWSHYWEPLQKYFA